MKTYLSITFLLLLLIGVIAFAVFKVIPSSLPNSSPQTLTKSSETSSSTSSLSKPSRWLMLTDFTIPWQVRVEALRSMEGRQLSTTDLDYLYSLLHYRPEDRHAESWWVIVNEIMEQFRLQGLGRDRYSSQLLAVLSDSSAPEVLRDYAIQHLGQWVTPRGKVLGMPYEESPEVISQVTRSFGQVITDPSLAQTSIPGTALMVLVDMQTGGASQEALAETLSTLQPWLSSIFTHQHEQGGSVSRSTRVSAINAIAMLGLTEYAPAIRQLVGSVQSNSSLRLSSIAALGLIGDSRDLDTLSTLAQGHSKYRFAASQALSSLNQNLTQ